MKEREVKKGKDEEVNGQGGKRGAPAPHGALSSMGKCGFGFCLKTANSPSTY